VIHNWIFAFLGNLVGAGVFIAGADYFLYGRDEYLPAATSSGARFDGDISATDRSSFAETNPTSTQV